MEDCQVQQWKGCCCCCKFQAEIRKHPWNVGEGKGSIMEVMGYGCMWLDKIDEKPNAEPTQIIFQNHKHGFCEMFTADWRGEK